MPLDKSLYTLGVPGLGEAILAAEYAEIEGTPEGTVLQQIKDRKTLGVSFKGQWYVEAPPFCEDKLRQIKARSKSKPAMPARETREVCTATGPAEIIVDDSESSVEVHKDSPVLARDRSRCPKCQHELDTNTNTIAPPNIDAMSEGARIFLPKIIESLSSAGYSMPHLRCPKCGATWLEQTNAEGGKDPDAEDKPDVAIAQEHYDKAGTAPIKRQWSLIRTMTGQERAVSQPTNQAGKTAAKIVGLLGYGVAPSWAIAYFIYDPGTWYRWAWTALGILFFALIIRVFLPQRNPSLRANTAPMPPPCARPPALREGAVRLPCAVGIQLHHDVIREPSSGDARQTTLFGKTRTGSAPKPDWSAIVTCVLLAAVSLALGVFACDHGLWRWLCIGLSALFGMGIVGGFAPPESSPSTAMSPTRDAPEELRSTQMRDSGIPRAHTPEPHQATQQQSSRNPSLDGLAETIISATKNGDVQTLDALRTNGLPTGQDSLLLRQQDVLAYPAAVRWIIQHGANTNVTDAKMNTPLHAVVGSSFLVFTLMLGHNPLEVLCVLLEAGADATAKNAAGKTPLDIIRDTPSELLFMDRCAKATGKLFGYPQSKASSSIQALLPVVKQMQSTLERAIRLKR
jgi:hypothetical protein